MKNPDKVIKKAVKEAQPTLTEYESDRADKHEPIPHERKKAS
jgi:hypothetical protein